MARQVIDMLAFMLAGRRERGLRGLLLIDVNCFKFALAQRLA
jgi:hypothetical protein